MKIVVTYFTTKEIEIPDKNYPLIKDAVKNNKEYDNPNLNAECNTLCKEVARRMLIEEGIEGKDLCCVEYEDFLIGEW